MQLRRKVCSGLPYGIYGDNTDVYDSSENYYYALLSYHDQNGFEPQMYLNINDSELFAGSMSYQDYCRVRGVYIGDMFYLVTEKGIVSYNIQKDYEQTGTLNGKLKSNKTMFLLYLLLAVIQRIVYTRKQLDENEDREV